MAAKCPIQLSKTMFYKKFSHEHVNIINQKSKSLEPKDDEKQSKHKTKKIKNLLNIHSSSKTDLLENGS